MKKVLMFGWEYPPDISGGLGIATHALIAGLAKQKTEVNFVLPVFNGKVGKEKWKVIDASQVKVKTGEIIEEEYWEKITYIEIASTLMPYISHSDYKELQEQKTSGVTKKIKVLKESYQFEGGYGSNLSEEVARLALVGLELSATKEFDVVHGHDWMTFPAALATGAAAEKPVVLHVHSTEFERSFPNLDQPIYDLEKKSFDEADHLIAVSQLTKDILVAHYGIEEGKITVVHNSYAPSFQKNTDKRKFPAKNPTITFLGRMSRQKAPSLFVDVAKTLSDRNGAYRFVMAGDGYLLDELKAKVAQLNLQDKFSFPGFISSRKVKTLLKGSDVFLMPASAEPFGMVALEAAVSGVPVILSKQTGALEVLPSAVAFECWETFKMADAIDQMISQPKTAVQYAKKVQNEAMKTDWGKAAKSVINVYNSL